MSLRIFIGYDSREPVGYHVCAHSILARASGPVSITPIVRQALPMLTRQRNPMESTEFAFSRFLVPYLSRYEGFSVFMDSDMLVRTDMSLLLEGNGPTFAGGVVMFCDQCDAGTCGCKDTNRRMGTALTEQRNKAVWVCQHDYTPKQTVKMDGKQQTAYPRKNWSSFMVFNNAQCRALTPDYVNSATGLQLHRFQWLDDQQVGSLPLDWNWLVGEYEPNPDAKILHYTNGLPCFSDYERCDHADLWLEEYSRMTSPVRVGPFSREAWMRHTENPACS